MGCSCSLCPVGGSVALPTGREVPALSMAHTISGPGFMHPDCIFMQQTLGSRSKMRSNDCWWLMESRGWQTRLTACDKVFVLRSRAGLSVYTLSLAATVVRQGWVVARVYGRQSWKYILFASWQNTYAESCFRERLCFTNFLLSHLNAVPDFLYLTWETHAFPGQ